jgi:hypothetical protein
MEKTILKEFIEYIDKYSITKENFNFENLKNIYNFLYSKIYNCDYFEFFKYVESDKTNINYVYVYFNEKYSGKLLKHVQKYNYDMFFDLFLISMKIHHKKDIQGIRMGYQKPILEKFIDIYEKMWNLYQNCDDPLNGILNIKEKIVFRNILKKILLFSRTSFYMLDLDNYNINENILNMTYNVHNEIIDYIWNTYKSSIITIDHGVIYFRWNPKLKRYLNNFRFFEFFQKYFKDFNIDKDYKEILANNYFNGFEREDIDNMIIHAKKKYITFSNNILNEIKIKGYPEHY